MYRFISVPLLLASCTCLSAQNAVFTPVQVSDTSDRPLAHVILSAKGDASTSPPTDKAGKTHLTLPASVTPGSNISLVLVDTPLEGLKFLSPWEGHATIPARDEVDVVLGVPGDPSMLSNTQVRQSIRGAIMAQAANPGGGGPGGPGPKPANPAAGAPTQAAIQAAVVQISAAIKLKPVEVVTSLNKFAQQDREAAQKDRKRHGLSNKGSAPTSTSNAKSNNEMMSMQSHGGHKH